MSLRDESGKGPIAALVVGGACFGYTVYGYYSNLSELYELAKEKEQIGEEIDRLRQKILWRVTGRGGAGKTSLKPVGA